MGLDITAHERVRLVRERDDGGEDDCIRLVQDVGRDDRRDGLADGFYAYEGKTISFRAGSYSGYNRWRSHLARMLGTTDRDIWRENKPGPFVELIHFSDCEGFIGPLTSAKLARDFFEWKDRAVAFADALGAERDWWLELYHRWQDAFGLASAGGVVDFH
jgi:hypothetical protein